MASYTFDGSGKPVSLAPTNVRQEDNVTKIIVDEFPTKAIPIIFLPGILGSPLRRKPDAPQIRGQYKPTWAWFPDFKVKWIGGFFTWDKGYADLTPAERKQLLDPNTTLALTPYDDDIEPEIVKRIGSSIPFGFSTNNGKFHQITTAEGEVMIDPPGLLSTQEALRRGWATVMGGSYWTLLGTLEKELRLVTYSTRYTEKNESDVHPIWAIRDVLNEVLNGEDKAFHGALAKDFPELDPKATSVNDYMKAIEPLLDNCRQYHYPVFAVGYNWLESNAVSANHVFNRIEKIMDYVQRQPDPSLKDAPGKLPLPGSGGLGWKCEDGVILVTHSMGGLVGRALAKKLEKDHPNLIRGVVHGVQPCDGSATLYARMKGGWEGVAGLFLAKVGDELMPVLTQSPGATELSPNQNYQAGWLRIIDGTTNLELDSFPKAPEIGGNGKCNPYDEIYLRKDAWWKLGEPALMDPNANTPEKLDKTWNDYEKIVKNAQKFHEGIDDYFHPNTYMHYGNSSKYKTWGTVTWNVAFYKVTARESRTSGELVHSYSLIRNNVPLDTISDACVSSFPVREGSLGAAQMNLSYDTNLPGQLIAYMYPGETNGDATVPFNSGNPWQAKNRQWENRASDAFPMSNDVPTSVRYIFEFKNKAFEHSESYTARNARDVTIYSILNIIGKGQG